MERDGALDARDVKLRDKLRYFKESHEAERTHVDPTLHCLITVGSHG